MRMKSVSPALGMNFGVRQRKSVIIMRRIPVMRNVPFGKNGFVMRIRRALTIRLLVPENAILTLLGNIVLKMILVIIVVKSVKKVNELNNVKHNKCFNSL
jgi:hypothetical protein